MSDPYSRLYHKFADEYPDIFDDPRALGTWVQLLVWADAAWPLKPRLPGRIVKSALAELCRVGLVNLDGDRYEIRGLAAERLRRRERAIAAGKSRGKPSTSSASAEQELSISSAEAEPSKAEQEKEQEQEQSRAREQADADPAVTYYHLVGKFPGEKALAWIDSLAERFGEAPVSAAIARVFIEDGNPSTILGRVRDRLQSEARELDRREREAEKARLTEKRSRPVKLEPWREELRASIEAQYRRPAA